MIEREAKLFEAGDYPDRDITFTGADLDAVIAGFKVGQKIPIKIGHSDTPFDGLLGQVTRLWRVGSSLMGTLSFPEHVWDFLEKMNTKKLSVGFDRLSRRIKEVSIVSHPRILTARVFSDTVSGNVVFEDKWDDVRGGAKLNEFSAEVVTLMKAEREAGRAEGQAAAETQFEARVSSIARENAEMKRLSALDEADKKILGWKAEGKLTPAAEKYAQAILVDGNAEVTFSDGGHMKVSESFVQFMLHQSAMLNMVKGTPEVPADTTSEIDKQVYALLGVTPEQVAEADKEIKDAK
jgi:hypothetical protein